MKLGTFSADFEKQSNIKFRKNPSTGTVRKIFRWFHTVNRKRQSLLSVMINVEEKLIIRTERLKIVVAIFFSGFLTYQITKLNKTTSVIATPATVNAHVLSAVLEISRWSIDSYGSTMATVLHVQTRNAS